MTHAIDRCQVTRHGQAMDVERGPGRKINADKFHWTLAVGHGGFLTADVLQRHNIWIELVDHASKERKFCRKRCWFA